MVDGRSQFRSGAAWRILVGLSIAAALALIGWLYSQSSERMSPSTTAMMTPMGSAEKIEAAAAVAPAAAKSAREPVAPAPMAKTLPVPATATVANELRGRVIDSAERPVQDARVSLQRGQLREFSVLDLELSRAAEQIAELVTGPSGEFRFALARGVPVDLSVESSGFCPVVIANKHAGEFVLVPLSSGFRVHGRVTRASDGAPVFGASVRAFRSGGPAALSRETRTAGNGSFELRITYKENATLEVVPQVEQCPGWIKLEFGAENHVEMNVAVEDGLTVVGKVTSAGTGLPIADATVGEGWVYRRTARTDAKGEYRLTGFGDPGVQTLFAKARGFGQVGRTDLPGAIEGVIRVDFDLPPARSAHGRVVDPSGTPLRGALAAAIASDGWNASQRSDWLSTRTDISGRFTIEDLTPGLRHTLLVTMHGFATSVYDFPLAEMSTADLDLGTFVLGPPALLAGSVEDEYGKGIVDVEVTLRGSNNDRNRLLDATRPRDESFGDYYTDARNTRSDAQGQFSFGDLSAGNYQIQARKRGQPQSQPQSVTVAEGEQREGVKIQLPIGSRLRGRVVDPEGNAVAHASLSADATVQRGLKAGNSSSTRSDNEGKFEFTGLSTGQYELSVYPMASDSSESDAPLLWTIVESVSTESTADLLIVLPRGETIRGTLLDARGVPAPGYSIFVKALPGQRSTVATTNAKGDFRLLVDIGSRSNLEVRGRREDDTWRKLFLTEPAVLAGTHDLKLVLP